MNFLIKGNTERPEETEVIAWGGDYGKVKEALETELRKEAFTFFPKKKGGDIVYDTLSTPRFYKLVYTPSKKEIV